MSGDGRLQLTILGGFLGSGKTTWLRHQLHAGAFRNALVIVNEASVRAVDDALLGGASEIAVLAGGCACCAGLSALIALLRGLADRRSQAGEARIDHAVLETSGLADPQAIAEGIRSDPVLVHHIRISAVIVTADAVNGLQQLKAERLSRRQIEAAHRLVVTKPDEAAEDAVRRLIATLRGLNPGAVIEGAVKGSAVLLPDAAGMPPEPLAPFDGDNGRPAMIAVRLALHPQADWAAFSVWLSALLHVRGGDIVRIKGVVRTPAGRLLLQSVMKSVQPPEILPGSSGDDGAEDNVLAVIGRGFQAESLLGSLRGFDLGSPDVDDTVRSELRLPS